MTNWDNDSIRTLERDSIRNFVARNRDYLRGRVLDFGAGKPGTCSRPEPYRDLVSGEYFPMDKGDVTPDPGQFDAILCTQVIQYLPIPELAVDGFHARLVPGGYLVLTYPTCWDEIEIDDLWRFTRAGMERLLKRSGFTIISHERRAEIDLNGFKFPLGYGAVACK